MPETGTADFLSLTETFVGQPYSSESFGFVPNGNFCLANPFISGVPSGTHTQWTHTVSIKLIATAAYSTYNGTSGCRYTPTSQVEVSETWSSDGGYNQSFTGATTIQALFGGVEALTREFIQVSVQAGKKGRFGDTYNTNHTVASFAIAGTAQSFFPHSFSQSGYTYVSGGSTLSASAPFLAPYRITGGNNFRGNLQFHVTFKPVDLAGNLVNKDVLIDFYPKWVKGGTPSSPGLTAGVNHGNTLVHRRTPIDETFEFPARAESSSYQLWNNPITGGPFGTDGHDLQGYLTSCRIVWRYRNFDGRADAPNIYTEVINRFLSVQHMWVRDAGVTDKPIAEVFLPPFKSLGQGTWSQNGSGSVAGDQLSAGETVTTFSNSFSPPSNARPYRWLAFDYVVHSSGPLSVVPITVSHPSQFTKEYPSQALSGSGTCFVDTLSPKLVQGVVPTSTIERFNQAQVGSIQEAISRFDGFLSAGGLRVRFQSGSITITNIRMVCRYSATLSHRSGPVSDSVPSEVTHWFAGEVDGRDAFRISNINVTDLVTSLVNVQGLGLGSTNYSLPSHAPFSSWTLRPRSDLATQDESHILRLDQSLLGSAFIYASGGSPDGVTFFYGRKELGWQNQVEGMATWGNEVAATSIPGNTTIQFASPSNPNETSEYLTNEEGFGRLAIAESRAFNPNSPSLPPLNVEHFAPHHKPPISKALYRFNGWCRRYHIYVSGKLPPGKGCVAIVSNDLGYMIAYVDEDHKLIIESRWHATYDVLLTETLDEGPGISEVRLTVDPERHEFHAIFIKENSLYRRVSQDYGDTWISPDGSAPYREGVMHARERFNPRTHEFLIYTMTDDLKIRCQILDYEGRSLGTFPQNMDGIGGQEFDDSSFDVEVWSDEDDGIDVVAMKDGTRARYRSSDEGRTYYESPL